MPEVLRFIKIFHSPTTEELFHNCACYWFAHILCSRFIDSFIVYNPEIVHFAAMIDNRLYDITGEITEGKEQYVSWEEYSESADDVYMIIENCILLN